MLIGSDYFHSYTRTVRRVYWAEMIDRQARERRRLNFRATLVGDPFDSRLPDRTEMPAVRAARAADACASYDQAANGDGGPGRT